MEIPTMRTQSRRLRCGLLLLLIPLGLAARRLASDDTVYAPDYPEARFRSVRIGMSRDDVIRALGDVENGVAASLRRNAWTRDET